MRRRLQISRACYFLFTSKPTHFSLNCLPPNVSFKTSWIWNIKKRETVDTILWPHPLGPELSTHMPFTCNHLCFPQPPSRCLPFVISTFTSGKVHTSVLLSATITSPQPKKKVWWQRGLKQMTSLVLLNPDYSSESLQNLDRERRGALGGHHWTVQRNLCKD